MEFLEQLLNVELGLPARFIIAFIVVLLLIALTAWIIRRLAAGRGGISGVRGRQQRLAIVDAAHVDTKRRLVLVRRDNTEHLILIGGPVDVVVESGIARANGFHEVEPPRAPARPAEDSRTTPAQPRIAEQPRPSGVGVNARPAPVPVTPLSAPVPSAARGATASTGSGREVPRVESVVRTPRVQAEPRFPMPEPRRPAAPPEIRPAEGRPQGDPNLEAMAQRLEASLKRPMGPGQAAPAVPREDKSPSQPPREVDLARAMAAQFNLDAEEHDERREDRPSEGQAPSVDLYDEEDLPRER